MAPSKWSDRPKSVMVKTLMELGGVSRAAVAEALGCSVAYYDNKLHRGSFSLEDIYNVARRCGFSLAFVSENDDAKIDISSFY